MQITERQKLQSLKNKNEEWIRNNPDFKEYKTGYARNPFDNVDDKLIIINSNNYYDDYTEHWVINLEEGINDLNRYFLTFNLGARLEGVCLDNYAIGIKGITVEDCLTRLIAIEELSFKDCYVSSERPKALKLCKVIHNCYNQYIYYKSLTKAKGIIAKRNIINIDEILC